MCCAGAGGALRDDDGGGGAGAGLSGGSRRPRRAAGSAAPHDAAAGASWTPLNVRRHELDFESNQEVPALAAARLRLHLHPLQRILHTWCVQAQWSPAVRERLEKGIQAVNSSAAESFQSKGEGLDASRVELKSST